MVHTKEISPALPLAPFVKNYAFREFDTCGKEIMKPWYASYETTLIFFFGDVPLKLIDAKSDTIVKCGKSYCDLVGMARQANGRMVFNGKYAFLQINFLPTALFRLFGVPSSEVADKICDARDVLNDSVTPVYEQLMEAQTLEGKTKLLDEWLIARLRIRTSSRDSDRMARCVNTVIRSYGSAPIRLLASEACMSQRTFERRFIDEVGIPPKTLACLVRFSAALEMKQKNPLLTWTAIAQQVGYFDQMHLIHQFKKFAGFTPFSLIRESPLLSEVFSAD